MADTPVTEDVFGAHISATLNEMPGQQILDMIPMNNLFGRGSLFRKQLHAHGFDLIPPNSAYMFFYQGSFTACLLSILGGEILVLGQTKCARSMDKFRKEAGELAALGRALRVARLKLDAWEEKNGKVGGSGAEQEGTS